MKWGSITATQDEDSFFEDYVRQAIASEPAPLPQRVQKIGNVTARWFPTTPGVAFLHVEGGNVDDRALAQRIVQVQLEGHGFKRAAFHLDWDLSDKKLIKEATWQDIEAKAKRLIESGKVHILRNGYNTVVGQVEGDHGDYQTEISRDDPESQAITLWQCECKWDQFAWQRTRQWKKYEGRVCAHVLATYWLAQTMPLDEDVNPAGPSQQPPGSPSPFGAPPGVGTGMVPPAGAPSPEQPGLQNAISPQPMPGEQTIPGQAPGPDLIPQYPLDPSLMPAINPVSVPGQKPQTPLNPIQNPGGTFSSVRVSQEDFINGELVSNNVEEYGTTVGLGGGAQVSIPANSVGEVLGVDPLGLVNIYFAGPQAQAGNLQPHGVTAWMWPKDLRKRPDLKPPGPAVRRHV